MGNENETPVAKCKYVMQKNRNPKTGQYLREIKCACGRNFHRQLKRPSFKGLTEVIMKVALLGLDLRKDPSDEDHERWNRPQNAGSHDDEDAVNHIPSRY